MVMAETFFVEEGNVGVAAMEHDRWLLASFLTVSSFESLFATISTAALDSGFASMVALDDAAAAASAAGGDGVGRCAATGTPPPPRLPSDAFVSASATSTGDESLVLGGETSFILLLLVGFVALLLR